MVMIFRNMENNIVELENKQENIDKLKAAHHLYSIVGYISIASFFLCVIVPIFISVLRNFVDFQGIVLHVIVGYSLIAVVLGIVFDFYAEKNKTLAAKIQQLFDCNILELEWNKYICGQRPSLEDINHNTGRLSNVPFVNWYDRAISPLSKSEATIICFRTNLAYDMDLRTIFVKIIDIVAFIVAISIIMMGFVQNEGIRDIVVFVIVPIIPMIKWFVAIRKQNVADIKKCISLKERIDDKLEKLSNGDEVYHKHELNQIQDGIFEHRKVAFKIPDFIYNYMRERLEGDTHLTVTQIIERYCQ